MKGWEMVYTEPEQASYAVYVTAKCSACGEAMFCNPADTGWNNSERGTVIWKGFVTNWYTKPHETREFAFFCAEQNWGKLPKYCAHCGALMKPNVVMRRGAGV